MLSETQHIAIQSPIGWLDIRGTEAGITEIEFLDEDPGQSEEVAQCLKDCASQLLEYFDGKRTEFDVPLKPAGTDFQVKCWNALLGIPFGNRRSYKEQALALRNEKAIRAVGAANGKNPISIIVPCHRVLGSDGSLTGYAGGLWRKEWLLKHEHDVLYGTQQSLF